MAQPDTTTSSSIEQQTRVHVEHWHRVAPPWLGTPEEVHTWLHEDMDRPCDTDHTLLDLRGVRP
jgi:hypothetical protein